MVVRVMTLPVAIDSTTVAVVVAAASFRRPESNLLVLPVAALVLRSSRPPLLQHQISPNLLPVWAPPRHWMRSTLLLRQQMRRRQQQPLAFAF